MAFRDTLKANLDVALTGSNVSVSAELPFVAGGEPLYIKNMKTLYLDKDNSDTTVLFQTLSDNNVDQTETTVQAFVSVDAKNPPQDIDTIVDHLINAKNSVDNVFNRECEISTELQNDVLVYSVEYTFITV